MTNVSDELREGLSRLSPKDQAFAQSLLAARRPSDKQMHWIGILVERTKAPDPTAKPERAKVDVGNMAGIVALFDTAAANLKFPSIVLQSDQGTLRLTVAQAHHRVPGSVNVMNYDNRDWYGRILRDGNFELSPKFKPEAIWSTVDTLRRFSADPAGEATRYARLTGRCAFCHLKLCDERSTAVGYGRTCASNYGLEWGKAKTTFVQASAHPDDIAMANAEAEADREGTIRDERRKSRRRIRVEI